MESSCDIKATDQEQEVKEEEEKTEKEREIPTDVLMDERKIDPEDVSPALESLERRQVLSGDAAAFLKAHNDKRRIVSPPATNMKEMTWSTELEAIARNYAKNCNFKHNKQRSGSSSTFSYVGENLYVSYGDISPEQAVTSWDDEKNDYSFTNNVCDPNSKYGCGHYTQVAWANSETVGCVKHFCSYVTNFGYRGYLVVCNYGPGGNINNWRPYTTGTTCKDCPAGYTCVNKLCSKSSGGGSNPCSTNPCKNGGTCSSVSGNAVCKCTSGWSGNTCETKDAANPCSPNPCQNGGTCTNDSGSAKCQCSGGWSGNTCTTKANTMTCNFENNMCLKNYDQNEVNFRRFSYFSMNNVRVDAPEGSSFACAYAGYVSGQKYSYLLSTYLAEAVVKVQFRYRVVGSARLSFIYKQEGKDYNTMFSYKNDNGIWQSWTVTIPSGKNTYFYFKATLESYSLVALDDVQISTIQ
ncbi:CRISP/Allergen/PR-1-like [Ostrea edulis]|uniref:CRISP/Allergen/PR-1-like n=1 Tax=Ostrea edulis TaxID=37623 RepID=UPI0024AEA9FD|nr:CRISP/Allergen/PR-1-like [Ostrea edulis]